MTEPQVEPGQVWADNDNRCKGRTIRVDSIDGDRAVCTVLTNPTSTQERIDRGDQSNIQDTRGKQTRISLRRFRPTSTGYRLLANSEEG